MALLGEVEVQRATTTSPCRLEIFNHVPEQGQRGEDGDFLLFVGLDAVFLRSDEIEQGLGMSIQFVEFPVLALGPFLLTTILVKDGKEERAVMQGTVLDCVVQLGHLKSRESEGGSGRV